MNKINQTTSTTNQSTAQIKDERLLMGWNEFTKTKFINDTGGQIILKTGMLMATNPNDSEAVKIASTDNDLINVLGILYMDNDRVVEDGGEVPISYCHEGMVNQSVIILPDGFSFDTIPAGASKTVGDFLRASQIYLKTLVENRKFDN